MYFYKGKITWKGNSIYLGLIKNMDPHSNEPDMVCDCPHEVIYKITGIQAKNPKIYFLYSRLDLT
jgi:hypothetical protein